MKKTSRNLTALIFCLTLIFSMAVPVFAVGKVGSLKVKAAAPTAVALVWKKVSGASGYQIQTVSGKKWKNVANTTKTTYTQKKLKPATTHKYRVRAFTKKGKKVTYGKVSSTVTVNTPLAKTAGLKAAVSGNAVTLKWSKVAAAKGYQVQQYKNKKWVKVASVTKNTAKISGLAYGTSHKFRVRAYSKIGKTNVFGAFSSAVTAKIPLAKTNKFAASQITSNSITLQWNKVAGAKGYQLWQFKNNKWTNIKTTTAASYKVSKLNVGEAYKFRLRAYKGSGKNLEYGAFTGTLTVSIPLAKTGGIKAATGINFVKLAWNKVPAAAGYQIQQYTAKGWVNIAKSAANTYTVSGLNVGTEYAFRIRAYSKSGVYGAFSDTFKAKPTMPAVNGLKVSTANANSVTLQWNAVSGVTGYEVYRQNGTSWVKVGTTAKNTLAVTGLAVGANYNFRVRAYKGSVYSAYTSTLSTRTAPAKGTAPKVASYNNTSAAINWNKAAGADSYAVYYYDYAGSKWVYVADTTALSYTFKGLKPNTPYAFTVNPNHSKNGFKLSGGYTASAKITTAFALINGLTLKTQDFLGVTVSWDDVGDGVTYDVERYDPAAKKWYVARGQDSTENLLSRYSYEAKWNAFAITSVTTSNYITTIKWPAQPSCSKYVVQAKPSNDNTWQTVSETSATSVNLCLAPDTDYEFRVALANGQVRVRGFKNGNNAVATPYASLSSIIETYSSAFSHKTPAAAFNANDNASKTAYTVKLLNALNATKHEQTAVTVNVNNLFNAEIESGHMVYNGIKMDLNMLMNIPIIGSQIRDMLSEDFTEKLQGSYVFNKNWGLSPENRIIYLDNLLAPEGRTAYLYNQNDVASFNKKISNITVTNNADETTTIKLVLPEESAQNGSTTPVHNGMMDSITEEMGGFSSLGDDAKIVAKVGTSINGKKVGKMNQTTITGVIKNGKLLSYKIDSPFRVSVDAKIDGSPIDMTLIGIAKYDYTFSR